MAETCFTKSVSCFSYIFPKILCHSSNSVLTRLFVCMSLLSSAYRYEMVFLDMSEDEENTLHRFSAVSCIRFVERTYSNSRFTPLSKSSTSLISNSTGNFSFLNFFGSFFVLLSSNSIPLSLFLNRQKTNLSPSKPTPTFEVSKFTKRFSSLWHESNEKLIR